MTTTHTRIIGLVFVTLTILTAATAVAEPPNYILYSEAHGDFIEHGKPMLIMVTATWCSACTELKSRMETASIDGDKLSVSLVDFDKQQSLAKALLNGARTLPHIVLFYKDKIKNDVRATRHASPPSNTQLRNLINDPRIGYPEKNK